MHRTADIPGEIPGTGSHLSQLARRTRTCLGIALVLVLGLLGREGVALCLSAAHLSLETQSLSQHEQQTVRAAECSAAACEDISLGTTVLSETRQKSGNIQKATASSFGGDIIYTAAAIHTVAVGHAFPSPSPERDPRLRGLRTVVLLN